MSKDVILDGMAWIPKSKLSDFEQKDLKETLTVRIEPYDFVPNDEPKIVEEYVDFEDYLGIPRAYYNKTNYTKLPTKDFTINPDKNYDCQVTPLDDLQENAISQIGGFLSGNGNRECILHAATGTGKTLMSLMIAAKLGVKTMVLVHMSHLLEQWREAIKGIGDKNPVAYKDVSVGKFQGSTEEYENQDIVVGMLQTLSNRAPSQVKPYNQYEESELHDIFNWPGMIIVDEVHNAAAPTLASAIRPFLAQKRLGLTATPERNTEDEQVFFNSIGDIKFSGEKTRLTPKVYKVETGFDFYNDYPKYVQQHILSRNDNRNNLIGKHIRAATEKSRRCLVLTKRIAHALLLKAEALKRTDASVGICTGSYYKNERDAWRYLNSPKKYQKQFQKDRVQKYLRDRDAYQNRFGAFEDGEFYYDTDLINEFRYFVRAYKKNGYKEVMELEEAYERDYDEIREVIPKPFNPEIHKVKWDGKKSEGADIDKIKPKRYSIPIDEFQENQKKQVVIGTYQSVQEAFDEPSLDTLFIAMPMFNPKQPVGRILRPHEDKKEPLVVHFVDSSVGVYYGGWMKCNKYYNKLGAKIIT